MELNICVERKKKNLPNLEFCIQWIDFLSQKLRELVTNRPAMQEMLKEGLQLLEENIGKTLSDINHSRIIYDPPPRVMEIKAKKQMGPN